MSAELRLARCHLLMTVDAVGGVWSYALDLVRGLLDRAVLDHEIRVTLAVLGPRASDAQRVEASGIAGLDLIETNLPLDWLSDSEADVKRAANGIAKIAREIGADLVQLNGSPLSGVTSFSIPLIAVHHSCLATWWAAVKREPLRPDWGWRVDLVARHLATSDRVVVPSAAFGLSVTQTYGLSERPLVIHNGRSNGASIAGADRQIEALFTAGRLWDEGKGIGTLDEAAACLDVPVFAAGPTQGPNGARIKCRHLRLLGELSNEIVRAWLAGRPIFVSASLYEPFGLSVLEAARAGCALLLSDIPTFRELWKGAAILVPPHDPVAFADAAKRLFADPALRSCLADAAQQRAKSFNLTRQARAMAELYGRVLKEKHVAPLPVSRRGARGKLTQSAGAAA
ncbi:MAG: glycosyltransferase family 4 protein [Hyphomicrobiales bacterium]|nr:glycosyltransferase family 4 protein [Hyphomicrobiales bacterium]